MSAPAIPTEAREELLALKAGALFVCARPDGEIRAGPQSAEGLYSRDTRHLSELRLRLGGVPPVTLSSTMESGHHAVVDATNPTLRAGADVLVPQGTLNIRRTLLIADRLHCRVRVRSFLPHPVETTIELWLGADFADVFEVRSGAHAMQRRVPTADRRGDLLRFAYIAADGERRETLIDLSPSPSLVELHEERAKVSWEATLRAGEAMSLVLTVEPVARGRRRAARGFDDAAAQLAAAHREWVDKCTMIKTASESVDRLVEASMRDLHALMMPLGGVELPAAGIPWYVAPFGRDSLVTALETLMVNPEVARGTLLALAPLQATADEPWRDAEPGKILHELRSGELARTGRIPHTPYYGTVDATPLFLMVAAAYYHWTGDLETIMRLRPALDAALAWIDEWGDRDGDGFVEYERRSPAGLLNHGWKDSADAVVHADGTLASGPVALVEVQGYVYAAKLRIADVYEALGDAERARGLRAQAVALRTAFNEAFWDADEGFFALALDGHKAQVRSVTSNPAHCLYCGIVADEKAARTAERLMAPDMFSGWGIRTLSSRSPAYNPMSYHNGSVWPHDNAIAAAGLRRYGFGASAGRIAGALFDVAAVRRDFRLPELFCGFSRGESRSIVAYPVACMPQAWATGAPFLLVQALLGISANAPNNRLIVERPSLPDWLESVDVVGLHVGASRVGLAFRNTQPHGTASSLLQQDGDVRVMMSA